MASKVEIPIRVKLLALISALLVASTVTYLSMAVKLFHDDKRSLVYELNASAVKTLAAQIDAYLKKAADKMTLLTQGLRDEEWTKAVFESEPDLVSYALFKPTENADRWESVTHIRNSQYLSLYGSSQADVDQLRQKFPIPFAKVLALRTWVGNSTLPGGTPILTLAMTVAIQDHGKTSQAVAVADLRLDGILKLVSGRGIATVFLVNRDGQVIAHPESTFVVNHAVLSENPIVQEAVDSAVAFQIKPFQWKAQKWLGAYSAVGMGGLSVISQVPEEEAFRASRMLVRKSLLFGLIVITASLLLSGWLAGTFTEPLSQLVRATEKLARWEFGESIHVNTRDEIAQLARAFNAMTTDLQRQRAELEASRTELERKVKERTFTLEAQKKQIVDSQDALLRTTRLASLGELAGSAAHEVLNPVNNINIRVQRIRDQLQGTELTDVRLLEEITRAWAETYGKGGWAALEKDLKKAAESSSQTLLEEDLGNLRSIAETMIKSREERVEDMEFFDREITRITRIVNGMRSLSRVGGERRPLDVHQPIDETIVTLGDLFEKRKISLVKDFGAETRDHYTVVGDKDEMVQVFSNLLRNSLHAIALAKRRAGQVRISTRLAAERVEVRIEDNGAGISAGNLARIFEPNFTTKSVEEGTGLGLSISRRLVRAFGGDIVVESTREGSGTTFLIWFPEAGNAENGSRD